MRQARKREILSFIESLHQAHGDIREFMDKHGNASARAMLAECQKYAIELGNVIEKSEGEECVTVSYVKEYCETLFCVFQDIHDLSANKAYELLKERLFRIENSVRNDILSRKEIVFFPYKASMWDSLESIYLAAKEDENCDAYVVPIPYYEVRKDKTLGEMHYEGNEYPKNIEITDYRLYNLEERHPDAIYIHNPYDEFNNVTCVPERYFSRRLRNYTDCLVYVPYFILEEIEPDDQKAIDRMSHFCFLPGVIYAHKVIVQSEKMRQIYINEYVKVAQEIGFPVDQKILEQKILGIGSPKLDKVQNTRKETLEIPGEWIKIIEKPDGTWKKIIFYNTGITELLKHGERMFKKMKSVFRSFEESKDEVVLLWRPHPLIIGTIKSMRPLLLEAYEEIVKEYKEAGWGIYDDSADMERAVVLSDAYYGDRSSVVAVYKNTGKPVLIQNVNVL